MLAPLRFVALEQLAGFHAEHVAQRLDEIVAVRAEASFRALQAIGGRQRNPLFAVPRNAVGRDAFLGKELGDSDAHVHNHYGNAGSGNKSTLTHITVDYWSGLALPCAMDANEEVAAIDAANEPVRLCVICHASYPVGIAGLCASCLYDFYPDDYTPTSTSEAHAA